MHYASALPTKARPFRVPFALRNVPVLPVIGILITLSLMTQFEPVVYMVGVGAIMFGLVVYRLKKH